MTAEGFVGSLFDVAGRHVLITGAASGMGRAMAIAFARAGSSLVLADIDEEGLASTLAMLPPDIPVLLHRTDIAVEDEVETLFAAAKAIAPVDVVINNAGVLSEYSFFEITAAQWDRVIAVNLRGQMLCIRAAMAAMGTHGGSIVNIGSGPGSRGAAMNVAFTAPDYVASKAGVQAMTRFAAQDGARHGIRVNAIAPGAAATPMHAHHLEEFEAAVVGTVPLGRLQRADDIVGMAIYLASSASSYVTGQTFHVNGGVLMDPGA